MSDLRSVLERGIGGAVPPPDGYERLLRRRDRQRRNQRLGAGVLGAGVLALIVVLLAAALFARPPSRRVPSDPPPSPPPTSVGPSGTGDVFVDVETGDMTPLPERIVVAGGAGDYAISPDGSTLLFDGRSDDRTDCWHTLGVCPITQIYLAEIDGTDIRQLTHERAGAVAGTWSPDGTKVAYVAGWGQRRTVDLVVIDVATGTTTRPVERLPIPFNQMPPPGFSPDGRSLLFTGEDRDLWTVPVEGGPRTHLNLEGLWGSYSPDGSMIVFLTMTYECCARSPEFMAADAIVLANADGTHARRLAEGPFDRVLWSPDGTRLVAERDEGPDPVVIIDVATGEQMHLTTGQRPNWFDDRTVIVE